MARFSGPDKLGSSHVLDGFASGGESLDGWLLSTARQAAAGNSASIFVVEDAEQSRVVGYYALAASSITHEEATPRAAKGMPSPIPAVLLARLAVDVSVQRQGIGALLLQDAMRRALSAAEQVAMRVMLVHAIDDNARAFYVRFGFESSPTDPLNLQMLFKDIRAAVNAAASG